MGKISANEASKAVVWGGGERTAEPGDIPLMPPFHDTRFRYHALIGQMSSRRQYRVLLMSRSYFSGKDFFL